MSEDKGGVDGLRKKLYSRGESEATHEGARAALSPIDEEAPIAWEPKVAEDSRPKPFIESRPEPRFGMSIASKFLIGSVVFFVAAAAFSAYYFFGGGNFISSQNIEIEIITPSLIDGGSVTQVQYIITNRNASPLLLADLIVDYPAGTRDPANPAKDLLHERQTIGVISPGQQIKRTSSAVFFGSEGATQTLGARLEYSVPNSNAVFEKKGATTFTVGSSPVSVGVEMPTEATAGEAFDIEVTLRSNAATPLQNVVFEARYPFGYTVRTASPRASTGALWRVGTLDPGETYVINIRGALDGSDGDEKVFNFLAGTNADSTDTKVTVPFLTLPHSLTIRRPFIGGSIAINGKTGSALSAPAGEPVSGTVTWRNNLSQSLQDVEIVLSFAGPALDKNSIAGGNGFYQSSDSSIIWTKQQDPSLASVAPGSEGTLPFSFSTLPPGTGGVVYANPTVTLTLGVKASRPGESGVPEEVKAAATTQVSLSSSVSLTSGASHKDGPEPPEADEQSTYEIEWVIKNSSNAVANAAVTTILPPYVEYVSGGGTTFDASSRTVRWSVGDLKPGAGYTVEAIQTSFTVRLTASASQVGQAPALTGSSVLQGTDRFAQVGVSSTAGAVTTGSQVQQ